MQHQCVDLQGGGTFNAPYALGQIDGLVRVLNCAPLATGASIYFSFTLTSFPGPDSYAGASFTLTQGAAGPVYPYIEDPETGQVLQEALYGPGSNSALWTTSGFAYTGRYQELLNLSSGPYILQEENTAALAGPTPYFNVYVNPDYTQ
jgi:hypothetical protein